MYMIIIIQLLLSGGSTQDLGSRAQSPRFLSSNSNSIAKVWVYGKELGFLLVMVQERG